MSGTKAYLEEIAPREDIFQLSIQENSVYTSETKLGSEISEEVKNINAASIYERKLHSASNNEKEHASTSQTIKPTVLGIRQARKRLQAFCIEKKRTNSSVDTSSKTSTADIGDHQSSSKNESKKSSNNQKHKKTTKKEMNGYERSKASFLHWMEMKKEEEQKLTLVRLGIPLGLVPGNTVVKGLTTKPMPSKAMPPVKNFLNVEEIEKLLNKAASQDSDFHQKASPHKESMFKKDSKLIKCENTEYKGKKNEKPKNKHDSIEAYSDSKKKNAHDLDEKKSNNLIKGSTTMKTQQSFDLDGSSKVAEYVIASIYGSQTFPTSYDKTKKGNEVSVPRVKSSSENVKSKEFIDMFEFDIGKKRESDDIIDDVHSDDFTDYSKSSIHKDEYLKEKFKSLAKDYPSPMETMEKNIFSCNSIDDVETNQQCKQDFSVLNSMSSTLDENKKEPFIFTLKPCLDSNLIDEAKKQNTLLEFNDEKEKNPDVSHPYKKENNFMRSKTKEIWENIQKASSKHFTSVCYNKTSSMPSILFCENLNYCKCKKVRKEGLERLSSNVTSIKDEFYSSSLSDIEPRISRHWYPKEKIGFENSLFNDWEVNDSETQELQEEKKECDVNYNSDLKDCSVPNLFFNDMFALSPCKNEIMAPSLDSEYEKFMEAVRPEISDDSNILHCNISEDKNVKNNISSPVDKEKAFIMNEDTVENNMFEMSQDMNKINEKDEFNEDVLKSNQMENKDDASQDKWDDTYYSDKGIKYKQSRCKANEKRKGHAKISSRRKKGNKKNHSDMCHYSASSADSSISSSDSKSSSDSSNSSDDSDSSSSQNSTNTDSSYDETTSSKSSTQNSDEESDENILTKHKFKNEDKLIIKARKLARKIKKNAKNTGELDEYQSEIEKKLEKSNHNNTKKEKGHLKCVEEIEIIKKYNELINEHEMSLSNISYQNLKDFKSDNCYSNKRKRHFQSSPDTFDISDNKQLKKAKSIESDTSYNDNDMFNIDVLKNIKSEKLSDEEVQAKSEKMTSKGKYKLEIISASELQHNFLQNNKNFEFLSDVKIESDETSSNKCINNTIELDISLKSENEEKLSTDCVLENKDVSALQKNNSTLENNIDNLNDIKIDTTNSVMDYSIQNMTQLFDIDSLQTVDINQSLQSADTPHRKRKRSRWGDVLVSESKQNDSSSAEDLIASETGTTVLDTSISNESSLLSSKVDDETTDPEQSDSIVYKIQTISSCSTNQNYLNNDSEMYDMDFDAYNKEHTQEVNIEVKPTRKISLDDRINMVLQHPGNIEENSFKNSSLCNVKLNVSPEKGILLVGGSKVVRSDPRLNRTKHVSFADGYTPGQDSDCDNEVEEINSSKAMKRKRRKSCGGHAYPCPETWPDYHSHWDRLPPPPPPPGSPPIDLFERYSNTLSSFKSNPIENTVA